MMISAFDLDRTLFNSNSSYEFGRYLCRTGHFSNRALIFIFLCNFLYTIKVFSLKRLHRCAFYYLFKGAPVNSIEKWVTAFLDQHFDQMLYEPAIQKLKSAKQAGHLTIILSSSPKFLVEPIAKRLEVSLWGATEYAIDKNGCYSHIKKLMLGQDKACFIEGLHRDLELRVQSVTAYSDSYVDIPFLLSATQAVGVNPDRKLRAFCLLHDWSII